MKVGVDSTVVVVLTMVRRGISTTSVTSARLISVELPALKITRATSYSPESRYVWPWTDTRPLVWSILRNEAAGSDTRAKTRSRHLSSGSDVLIWPFKYETVG